MDNELKLPTVLPDDFVRTPSEGLTSEEADIRFQNGESNIIRNTGEKTVWQILASNVFTLFNLLNICLAICLLAVGSYRNMLFILVVGANLLIGTFQEFRARNTIRRMHLLNSPQISVIRGGHEITCPTEQLVRGDLVILRAGDQVPADALVITGIGSANESLLTGESDSIPKSENDWLYSGSYISEGRFIAQLVYVSDESYVGKLTHEAKKTARPKSMLMTDLNRLVHIISMFMVPLGLLLFAKQFFLQSMPITDAVPKSVAAMIGMIPEGLILLTSVALAAGVVKLALRRTVVQELYGIETLARIDVLCLDKTGTITTGGMELTKVEPVNADEAEITKALSRFIGAFDESSGTLNAIRDKYTPSGELPTSVLPFSSARKKSAASFADGTTLIFGAPEFVLGSEYPDTLKEQINKLADEGHRVTVLAESHGTVTRDDAPAVERILCLCIMTDTIRSNAAKTLEYFRDEDVTLKVISGDNPITVSRIAKAVGLSGWDSMIDASTLDTQEKIDDACDKYTVFGRVTPSQKKLLVEALKRRGHNVAMTGDGVNDIPALKASDCSIAMASGSSAAQNASQFTLLDSDFSVMPDILLEGRRVVNNINRTASLFLNKTVFSLLLSALMLFLPGVYPFQPIQMSLVSTLAVGFPSFFLALEPSKERIEGNFLRSILMKALPGGIAVAVCSTLAMLLANFGYSHQYCSTVATLIAGMISLIVLLRTCLPLNLLRGAVLLASTLLFAAAVIFLPEIFMLEILTSDGWLAFTILSLFGIIIVFGTAAIIRRSGRKRFN